ncbi:hypothetical protein T265_10511 [Opisthorchis viverrini]|uniref:Uncharacterized protein n=1 Tax=Opisthorchis viverrini TaxID=6198 RepID=A0A074Z6B0_OPIVI|nr:hypothetical protein T265_10511 [Opisthorchis viverrini]KER21097.1 hypothetical protein T265_10511 [Opisthorchis viverrini]
MSVKRIQVENGCKIALLIPSTASRLLLSTLGQPDSITALVSPPDGRAAAHRNCCSRTIVIIIRGTWGPAGHIRKAPPTGTTGPWGGTLTKYQRPAPDEGRRHQVETPGKRRIGPWGPIPGMVEHGRTRA